MTGPWRAGGVRQSSLITQLPPWRPGSSSTGGSAAALTAEPAAHTHTNTHRVACTVRRLDCNIFLLPEDGTRHLQAAVIHFIGVDIVLQ